MAPAAWRGMAIYHFNLMDSTHEQDIDGTRLPSLHAARLAAISFAGDMAKERGESIWAEGSLQVEVTDAGGRAVLMVTIIATSAPANDDV